MIEIVSYDDLVSYNCSDKSCEECPNRKLCYEEDFYEYEIRSIALERAGLME